MALGGIAGVGAGVDIGVYTKDTEAWIGSGAKVSALGDVRVLANSEDKITSAAVSAAGGLTAGIAGAVDVYVINVTTKAYVDASRTVSGTAHTTTVNADGTVQIAAESKSEIDFIGTNVAVGGVAGIGGALVVPIVTKTTYAYIGAGASVDAKGKGALDVRDGTFAISFVDYFTGDVSAPDFSDTDVGYDSSQEGATDPRVDQQLTHRRDATPGIRSGFRGVAVTAINSDDVGAYGIGVSASGTASVQLSAAIHVMTADTQAWVGNGANVNQGTTGEDAAQSVLVAAGNDYAHIGVAGGVAASGVAAITPGLEIGVILNTVKAYVDANAKVDAMKDVDVRARSTEDMLAISIAIAASGLVGVGGAVTVVVIDNEHLRVRRRRRARARRRQPRGRRVRPDGHRRRGDRGRDRDRRGRGRRRRRRHGDHEGHARVDRQRDGRREGRLVRDPALRRQPLPAHLGRRRAGQRVVPAQGPQHAPSAAWPSSPSRARASSRSPSPARAASGRASPARSPSR